MILLIANFVNESGTASNGVFVVAMSFLAMLPSRNPFLPSPRVPITIKSGFNSSHIRLISYSGSPPDIM